MITAIYGKRLIDGTGRPALEPGLVLVEGERILAADSAQRISPPDGAEIILLDDLTLLPGFIDVHGHLALDHGAGDVVLQMREPEQQMMVAAVGNLRFKLRSGVTTMRVCGEKHYIDVTCRAAVEAGQLPGPRLLIAGKALRAPHGHGSVGTAVSGKAAIRDLVRENLAQGVDLIKLFTTGGTTSHATSPTQSYYTAEEIAIAIDESHRAGRRVAVHAHGGEGLRLAVELGADTIEHGVYLTAEDARLMAERGTWLDATNGMFFDQRGIQTTSSAVVEKVEQARTAARTSIERARAAGVKLTVGTDDGRGHLALDVELLHRWGFPAMEAILAATRQAADACGQLDRLGTLEPGKLADLIGVRGDPLTDIRALNEVAFVMKGGLRYDALSDQ
jgi:imidazolonepropionase-like amidohydrolase